MLAGLLSVPPWYLLLALLGAGPALLATGGRNANSRTAWLALAPAMGWAILLLAGYPLYHVFGPVSGWAWAGGGGLVLTSGILAVLALRGGDAALTWNAVRGSLRTGIPVLLACASIWLAHAAPAALGGLRYGSFRSNPSDAFLYQSLAESVRLVPETDLEGATEFAPSNVAALDALAERSPASLFSARLVSRGLSLPKPIAMAWLSELTGVRVATTYYAHHILALIVAFTVFLALGTQAGLSRWWGLGAMTLYFVGIPASGLLETDAGYEIASMPLLAAALYFWGEIPLAARTTMRPVAAVGLLMAACGLNYLPSGLLAAVGMVIAIAWAWVAVRRFPVRLVYSVGIAALLSLVLLVGSLNGLRLARSAERLGGAPKTEAAFAYPALRMLELEGTGVFAGLPSSAWLPAPVPARKVLSALGGALGVSVMLGGLVGAILVARRNRELGQIPGVSVGVFGALVLAGVLAGLGLLSASGRALFYGLPYVWLSVAALPAMLVGDWKGWGCRAAFVGIAVGGLCAVARLPAMKSTDSSFFGSSRWMKRGEYQVERASDIAHDSSVPVVVSVPRRSWQHGMHLLLNLGGPHTVFVEGAPFDNRDDAPLYPVGVLPSSGPFRLICEREDPVLSLLPNGRDLGVGPNIVAVEYESMSPEAKAEFEKRMPSGKDAAFGYAERAGFVVPAR